MTLLFLPRILYLILLPRLHISDQFLPHPERTVHFFIIDIPVIRRREDDHGQHRYADQEFDQIANLVDLIRIYDWQQK